ncbi:MAG: hypothetical protein REI12_02455 [Pedobacter sp.]|nr:hypothetical protein [Pedobacter sp.]
MFGRLSLILLIVVASHAEAEERFYQVIDAGGRVQVIREEVVASPAVAPAKKAADSPVPPSRTAVEKVQVPPSVSDKKPGAPYAAYDGGEYVDSEAMDESHQTNNERQRFVILNDGVGQRIENMDGSNQAFSSPSIEQKVEEGVQLKNTYLQLPVTQVQGMTNGCMSPVQRQQARSLASGRLTDVVFDRALSNFVTTGQLVEAYRINDVGVRTISLHSYSRTDFEPAFVVPFIAFADSKGCINRIVDGYFQRFYPETKSRHPLLEASLLMHSGDEYLLLIMPERAINTGNYQPEYRISSLGRVSIKWQP